MDSLMKWREPAAWVVLVALAVNIALVVPDLFVFQGPPSTVASVLAYRVASPLLIIVLAVLAATCVLIEPTPHARLLGLLALVVTAIAVLASVVLAVIGLTLGGLTSVLDLLTLLTTLAVPVVGLGVLVRLRSVPSTSGLPAALPAAPPLAPAVPPPPPPNPQFQPIWQPGAAAGAVWRTAGEAASGAPASGWGTTGPADPDSAGEEPTAGRWSN